VVLAGGAGRRLGGRHKPGITVAGRPLLDHALAAVAGADRVVVVGPPQPTAVPVVWTREEPAGGGPVAALVAGLAECDGAQTVVVLAADLVGVTVATVDRLRAELARQPSADGVVLVDHEGHRQWLIGAWRTAALRAALPAHPHGVALRATLAGLAVTTVPERPGESADIDTPDDLAAALATHRPGHGAGGPSRPSHW